jgi:phosphomannomutase
VYKSGMAIAAMLTRGNKKMEILDDCVIIIMDKRTNSNTMKSK